MRASRAGGVAGDALDAWGTGTAQNTKTQDILAEGLSGPWHRVHYTAAWDAAAKEFGITSEQAGKIAVEGVVSGWPMP